MAVEAGASMDCAGTVTVHVANKTTGEFHGQSSTAGSWIVMVDLNPGESADYLGKFGSQKSVEGYVRGPSVEGYVNVHWVAARAAECGAPSTPPPTPVDTTPHPLPTTPEDPVVYCQVPGANPPMKVPCDDPRATTPYVPPTTSTLPPVESTEPEATTVPINLSGPVHVVTAAPKAPPATLPHTGGVADGAGIAGSLALLIGAALVVITRRRAHA